jgi:hypothetical protein
MDQTTELLTGVAAAAVAALAAFAIYRWRQRERVRSVKTWVKTYVADHYDGTAANLRIDSRFAASPATQKPIGCVSKRCSRSPNRSKKSKVRRHARRAHAVLPAN